MCAQAKCTIWRKPKNLFRKFILESSNLNNTYVYPKFSRFPHKMTVEYLIKKTEKSEAQMYIYHCFDRQHIARVFSNA